MTVGTPTFTATAGTLTSKGFTLPLTDLCSGGSSCSLSCVATVPATGSMGQPMSFAATATPSNCTGTPTYDWDFGDGTAHAASQNASHSYASEGTFHWQMTATLNGVNCTEEGSITVTQAQIVPPAVSAMKKVSPPFTIVATGSGFQNGIKVYINGTQWPSVLWKNEGKIKLNGSSLKAAVPKGVATEFRFVNPDGGEATKTWNW